MPEFTQQELSLMLCAIDDRIDATELYIKTLDEPDERYERNDLQQDLARLQSARNKIQGAIK